MKNLILVAMLLTVIGNAYAENQGVANCGATLDGEERSSKQVDENGNKKLDDQSGSQVNVE